MRIFLGLLFIYGIIILTSLGALATESPKVETAVVAGGCFWCVESDFEKLDGVTTVISGYAGGDRPNPNYQDYSHVSNMYHVPHIEVAQITYDTTKLTFKDIVEYLFHHIDPTDNEGQFCDRGASYRPAVFVEHESQRKIVEDVSKEAAEELGKDIKVDILKSAKFYPAEQYHQDYYKKNPTRYKFYRWKCGRDQRVEELWGDKD